MLSDLPYLYTILSRPWKDWSINKFLRYMLKCKVRFLFMVYLYEPTPSGISLGHKYIAHYINVSVEQIKNLPYLSAAVTKDNPYLIYTYSFYTTYSWSNKHEAVSNSKVSIYSGHLIGSWLAKESCDWLRGWVGHRVCHPELFFAYQFILMTLSVSSSFVIHIDFTTYGGNHYFIWLRNQ